MRLPATRSSRERLKGFGESVWIPWVRDCLRIEGRPNVRIWLDKAEVSYAERASGPKNKIWADGWLFIGASSESDENAAHALLDDFTVQRYSLTPR